MSLLKQVNKGGVIAWSESKKHSCLFAVATIAEGAPESQTVSADIFTLEICSFDSAEKMLEPSRLGKTFLSVSASSITWSTFGEDTGKYPYGVICVGHSDGSLSIFNAGLIISESKKNTEPILEVGKLCHITEFSVPVSTIEFNSYKPNLIAMGGDEVLVVDISKEIENPDIIAPGETNLHQGGLITSVSWNKRVPHILASASSNGVAVVWNLKTSQVSFQIPDIYQHSEGSRNLSLAWNPEIPLQFAINYHDEKKPELHIWDLRDVKGPYVVLENGHTHGIESLSWSTQDPSLIVTGGLDQKVVIWNVKTKEILSSFSTEIAIKQVQWSKIPSLFSVQLEDGTIQLFSLNADELASHPPKWYQPVVGGTFAPNNQFTYFSVQQLNYSNESKEQEIVSCQYQTKDENYQDFLRWFQELDKVIDDQNPSALCELKLKNIHAEDSFELDQWRLLRGVAYGTEKEILDSLGFSKAEIIKKAEDYTGRKHNTQVQEEQPSNNRKNTKVQKQLIEFATVNEEQADDFFNTLTVSHTHNAQPQADHPQQNSFSQVNQSALQEEEVYLTEVVSKNKNWDTGVEKMIKENMIVGNYEGAIDCALKCGRVPEALLIAYSQGTDLFQTTMDQYFTQQTDSFIKYVFRNLVKKDIQDIAENSDLKSWRECAGIAITTSKSIPEFQKLMNKLAERFIKEKSDDDSAICCFILSQNFAKLVEIYHKRIQALKGNTKGRAYYMVQSVEKLVLLRKVMLLQEKDLQKKNGNHQQEDNSQKLQDNKFDSILLELSKLALAHTRIAIAYKILDQGNPLRIRIAELKDQLFNIYSEDLSSLFQKPIVPYSYIRIPVSLQGNNQTLRKKNQQEALAAPEVSKNAFNNQNNQNLLLNKNQNQYQPLNNNNSRELKSTVFNETNQRNGNGNNQQGQYQPRPPFNPRQQEGVNAPPLPSNLSNNEQLRGQTGLLSNPQQNNRQPIGFNNKMLAPPISSQLQDNYPPMVPPPLNNQSLMQNQQQQQQPHRGPPVNPNNKIFTEQVGNKAIAPPRPQPGLKNQSQPLNPQQMVPSNNSSFMNQSANDGLNNRSNPVQHTAPHPPPPVANQNKGRNPIGSQNEGQQQQLLPPSTQGASRLQQPPPVFPPNARSNANSQTFGQQQQNAPFSGFNNNEINSNLPGNKLPVYANTSNQGLNTSMPPPVQQNGSGIVKAASNTNSSLYQASPEEISAISNFVNQNSSIFGQVDPKKKDEHLASMDHMIDLLNNGQLKRDQVQLLLTIAQEFNNRNQKEALAAHVNLSKIDFSINKSWIQSLKRIVAQK